MPSSEIESVHENRSFGWRWRALTGWVRHFWAEIKPGPEASRGLFWGILATVAWAALIGAFNLKSGFGFAADLVFAILVAAIGIPLVALTVALLITILRKLPRLLAGLFVGAAAFVSLLFFGPVGYGIALAVLITEGLLGAAIATLLRGNFRMQARSRQTITVILLCAAVGFNAYLFSLFHSDGVDEKLIEIEQHTSQPAPLKAENPALRGPHSIKVLFYGPGTDLRRQEYGRSVAVRTRTVNASRFFKDFKGWKADIRERYWGFGADKFPLNGRVWYPEGPGPFPLVLIVHGNHDMAEFSDPGYAYLGELLASRGFILASIDENFLNSGLFVDPPKQQAVRGWMLLEHLKLWHEWNRTKGNPFFGKVDLDNVALMGHSRGGEAAATAFLFNKLSYYPDDSAIRFHYGFPIKAVVAIAPADGQYKPAGQWRIIQDVNYFTVQGANDADVSSFAGSRQWDHVRYSGNGSYFKSELYIYRANHGQFNTVWGRTDTGAPGNWFLNLHPLLTGEDQRKIAKTYISAFLEATLHNRNEYRPLFEDYRRIQAWLPKTLYINRYVDSSQKVISDFSEDADLTTTTVNGGRLEGKDLLVWHEGRIPFRRGDRDYNGVFLGWNRAAKKDPHPVYSIALPPELASQWDLNSQSVLNFSIAVTDEEPPEPDEENNGGAKPEKKEKRTKPELTDFTVEAVTGDGVTASVPLSRFGVLLPPFKVKFLKLGWMDKMDYKNSSEPIFQTVDIPLSGFADANRGFNPAKVTAVRLRFNRTAGRVIIISSIGFEKPGFSPQVPPDATQTAAYLRN